VDCHRKVAEKKANYDKQSTSNKNRNKPSDVNEEENKYCFKLKQKGHLAKNYSKKKPKMPDAFFIGMALTMKEDDILDNLQSSSKDFENKIIL